MPGICMKRETNVVVLRNMVGVDDLQDEFLEAEIFQECARYGTVNRVIFHQEPEEPEEEDEVVVKIFVEFNTSSEANKARDALNGRFFAGRNVHAELYDLTLYEANDLSA